MTMISDINISHGICISPTSTPSCPENIDYKVFTLFKLLGGSNDEVDNVSNSMDVQTLYGVQTGIALYLKDACKCLADFQDLLTEVRLLANEARALQMETGTMMTRAAITINHITETMIPLVYKGIESQDIHLLGKAFDQVIEHAKSMSTKPKETADRYIRLQQKVTDQIKEVEARHEMEQQEYSHNQKKVCNEEELTKQAEIKQKKLNTMKQSLDDEMTILKDQLLHERDEVNSDLKSGTNRSSGIDPFEWFKKAYQAVVGNNDEMRKIRERNNRKEELENKIQRLMSDHHDVSKSLHEVNKDVIERKAALEELKARKVKNADAKSLKQVRDLLERVHQHLGRVALFWESMTKEVLDLKSVVNFGKNMHVLRARDRFKGYETLTQKQLTLSQRQMANCLELTYIASRQHAEVAGKVRQTAHDARSEELRSLGMMKKLKVTAQHIIDTLIPYIEMGVSNKDPKLLQAAITMTSHYVKAMEQTSDETVQSYSRFQEKIMEMQLYVTGKQADLEEETQKLQKDIQKQKKLVLEALAYQEEKERERHALIASMKSMEIEQRNRMRRVEQDCEKAIEVATNPNWLDGLVGAGVLVSALTAGVRAISAPINVNVAINDKNDSLRNLQVLNTQEQNRLGFEIGNANKSLLDNKFKALTSCSRWTDLEDKKAALVNPRHLHETSKYACRLGGQFTVMQMFWQKMSESFDLMEKRMQSSVLLLHDEKYGAVITETCQKALTDWKLILDICTQYDRTSTLELKKNYEFLEIQYEQMSEAVADKRKTELLSSIESASKMLE
ncbi:uncharacterized protein LOC127840806 isoform X3 [Dreissena polymorpha]|uniref:uncharacterized protein LOC127840806 isoform X3 n=1 Tax=Dreissena polymorpha TaxID=45954 RepID=UPI0022654D6B|nr:uncharacterized protein LOC127840806 isoform X3 [Dreissena polymorpha]